MGRAYLIIRQVKKRLKEHVTTIGIACDHIMPVRRGMGKLSIFSRLLHILYLSASGRSGLGIYEYYVRSELSLTLCLGGTV